SAPGMLRAGAPTPLAVTLFSDFSASVTAEVMHGNTKVALTQNFQGGDTSIILRFDFLVLPGSIPDNSLLKLNVWGYKDNQIIFANTTDITFSHRNVSSFIQTDRSSYRPGSTIKIRVVSIQLDNRPYRGKLNISLQVSHILVHFEYPVPKKFTTIKKVNIGSDEGPDKSLKIYVRYEVNKSAEVHITHSPYQLQFLHFSQPLKPSLDFSARLQISRYDKRPLGLEELLNSAVVEVTQTDSSRNGKNTTLMLPVAENGTAKVQFKLQEHIAALFITVSNLPGEITKQSFRGKDAPVLLHVSSKGQVVAAGTKNSSSFSLTPDLSWSPQACITVYCLLSDGELISDSVFIPIQKHNLVRSSLVKQLVSLLGTPHLYPSIGILHSMLQSLTVSKDFSLSLVAPPHIIRGEEIVLEANIFNYLEHNLEVCWTEPFLYMSVINAKQLTIGSHASASALFPIEPLVLGEMEISVEAVSMEASDSVVWKLLVKPEGIEQSSSQTLFLELAPQSDSYSRSISFSFPPHVVPGSQMARVALGDILALSINNLDSLVQVPIGCGEQNMIHLAPSLYVLQYLDKSGQDDAEIRSRALGYLTKGYQTQLSYQRDDGSFSAFGESDASGSTWLTAFVLRCFLQAQTYIQVDQEVLIQALMWLLKHQGQQGEFLEVGRLIHTEMQGGMDDSSVALTAFVLEKYASKVSLALNYLENKLSSGVVSNYSLSLVAYALARGNRPLASRALTELKNRADNIGGVMMWTSSAGLNSHDLSRVQSAQIEMAAYVLLALFVRGSFIEGIELMKWLSIQTNHLGGFGTTQDTVIALQALAYYAAFSGANAINLKIDMSSSTSSFKMSFNINSTNYRMSLISILKKIWCIQNEEAFSLNIHLAEASNHNNQIIPNTGMVIVDVGMLSGLGLLPEATFPSDLVRKVESTPEKVHLYLDSLNKTEVCMRLPIIRNYKVARVRDAMVLVYDYYEPTRRAKRTYNSESLYTRESCSFCGENCNLCQSGIHISMSNSQAADDRTFRLSFLFLEAALVSLFAV
uniref:CD109 molecule n=1 Tax=Oryzias latipes TaxID=8090 RepID=A0A3P9JZJ9_ORYLA